MAKAPSKRRGITLGPSVGSAASLKELSAQMAASPSPTPDPIPTAVEPDGADPGAEPKAVMAGLEELRRADLELDLRWRRQDAQLQAQLRQLDEQRELIALQTRQLQALERNRRQSARVGVLLSLMTLSAVAALGFHTWPRLQDVADDFHRVSATVSQLAPQVQAVRGEMTLLTSDLGQMGGTMASVRKDVSDLRSELGSLRQAVHTLPEGRGPVQADTGARRGAAQALPRTATTMVNPYRGMRPMMPW